MKRLITSVTTLALLVPVSVFAQAIVVTRSEARPTLAIPAEHFTGSVRMEGLFEAVEPSHVSSASVTFEPGARTAWHAHPRGQLLIVTAGTGRVQRWGDQVQEMRQGDVVRIPAGQKHWHGAAPTSSMTHIAIQEHLGGAGAQWMEKVSDEQYRGDSPAIRPSSSRKFR